jgi:hypothetical protein
MDKRDRKFSPDSPDKRALVRTVRTDGFSPDNSTPIMGVLLSGLNSPPGGLSGLIRFGGAFRP